MDNLELCHALGHRWQVLPDKTYIDDAGNAVIDQILVCERCGKEHITTWKGK